MAFQVQIGTHKVGDRIYGPGEIIPVDELAAEFARPLVDIGQLLWIGPGPYPTSRISVPSIVFEDAAPNDQALDAGDVVEPPVGGSPLVDDDPQVLQAIAESQALLRPPSVVLADSSPYVDEDPRVIEEMAAAAEADAALGYTGAEPDAALAGAAPAGSDDTPSAEAGEEAGSDSVAPEATEPAPAPASDETPQSRRRRNSAPPAPAS